MVGPFLTKSLPHFPPCSNLIAIFKPVKESWGYMLFTFPSCGKVGGIAGVSNEALISKANCEYSLFFRDIQVSYKEHTKLAHVL